MHACMLRLISRLVGLVFLFSLSSRPCPALPSVIVFLWLSGMVSAVVSSAKYIHWGVSSSLARLLKCRSTKYKNKEKEMTLTLTQ